MKEKGQIIQIRTKCKLISKIQKIMNTPLPDTVVHKIIFAIFLLDVGRDLWICKFAKQWTKFGGSLDPARDFANHPLPSTIVPMASHTSNPSSPSTASSRNNAFPHSTNWDWRRWCARNAWGCGAAGRYGQRFVGRQQIDACLPSNNVKGCK